MFVRKILMPMAIKKPIVERIFGTNVSLFNALVACVKICDILRIFNNSTYLFPVTELEMKNKNKMKRPVFSCVENYTTISNVETVYRWCLDSGARTSARNAKLKQGLPTIFSIKYYKIQLQ